MPAITPRISFGVTACKPVVKSAIGTVTKKLETAIANNAKVVSAVNPAKTIAGSSAAAANVAALKPASL